MNLNCVSENAPISSLSDLKKLTNACAKRNNNIYKKHKYYPTSDCCANFKLTNLAINNQDPSRLFRINELKVHLIS